MRSRFLRGSIFALYVAPLLTPALLVSPMVVAVAIDVPLPSSGTCNGGSCGKRGDRGQCRGQIDA